MPLCAVSLQELGCRKILVEVLSKVMSTQNQAALTPAEAEKILNAFICTNNQSVDSSEEKSAIRAALVLLSNLSDYQMLGICADTVEQGLLAAESYLKALGYTVTLNREAIAPVEGAAYIKYNTLKGSYYADSYTGQYRGVLVSCQSASEGGINGTYGHLPLDLFA